MPKKRNRKKAKDKTIPKYGRPEKSVRKDMGLQKFSANVPIGNTNPTMVRGIIVGGMPNASRMARGGLYQQRGRYGG